MSEALDLYEATWSLVVRPHVIWRAVLALHGEGQYVEALALIRGAFAGGEGTQASLADAKTILNYIVGGIQNEAA